MIMDEADLKRMNNTATPDFTPIEFTGKGLEYFQIWIVNLFLSLITLGVYSAWATVRSNRYFYSHTRAQGHALRYLAEPAQILKGRVIALLLFAVFYAFSAVDPLLFFLSLLLLAGAAPLLVCLSLRFSMRMTAYRNVRFAFGGRYGGAFFAFVVCPLLAVLSLGLAYPWARKKMDEFTYGNIRYGDRGFDSGRLCSDRYYVATFWAVLCAVGGVMLCTLLIILAVGLVSAYLVSNLNLEQWLQLLFLDEIGPVADLLSFALSAVYLLVFLLAGAIYIAMIRNHLFNHVVVPGLARFESRVKIIPLAVLWLTNLLLIAVTFGLALPWIRVRRARFFAAATGAAIGAEIDEVITRVSDKTSAIGEEVSTMFDMDVGIG